MQETLADKLNRLLEDENRSKDLQKINPDTYKEIAAHIKSIRTESSEIERNMVSELSFDDRQILFRIARRLIELRISKFKQVPDSDVSSIVLEERYFAEPLIQSSKRFERVGQALFNGQTSELERISDAVKQKYVIVRFAQPYSAVSGTDLATYGPFEPHDLAKLPLETAQRLTNAGITFKTWIEPEE